MARQVRIEYEGAFYHVIARGNERRPIVRDDDDRSAFVALLAESLGIASARLHAFCLMDNHYHLLVETPLANLSRFVRRLNHTYALRFNRRHRRLGHLFHGRFRATLVDHGRYLAEVARYIHLNPMRTKPAAALAMGDRLRTLRRYAWSSLPGYLDVSARPPFLCRDTVLEESGLQGDDGRGYWRWLVTDPARATDVEAAAVGGVAFGSDAFIGQVARRVSGLERRERPAIRALHAYAERDRVIGAVETATGLAFSHLKSDPGWRRHLLMEALVRHAGLRNVEVARLLELAESTVSQGRKRLAARGDAHDGIAGAFLRLESLLRSDGEYVKKEDTFHPDIRRERGTCL